MEGIYLSSASYLLLAALALIVLGVVGDKLIRRRRGLQKTTGTSAPGPKPWPIFGSLHLMAGYEVPYQAFDSLAKKYGNVFSIKLGQFSCLVVSDLENIKEVLVTKGDHFDGRPNFYRYHLLFSGDKENSLAFCDWSEIQKTRREMLRDHTFPRAFTTRFHLLDGLLSEQLNVLCSKLMEGTTNIKPLLMHTCANVFLSYFCSTKFSWDDPGFCNMARQFDAIFYEANQGYAADFMPWLMPLHANNLRKMKKYSHAIREFMINRIIQDRLDNWLQGQEQQDYVDALIDHVKDENASMNIDTALFALEDIVGGHSAVTNFLVKIIGFIAALPEVQNKIKEEVDAVSSGNDITLADRSSMPYTEAVILESLRHISSPIVPHVANRESSVAGYTIEKDTLIFLNNYTLNMSPELWSEPEKFKPERFISEDGRLVKPDYFLPFGGGRRSCMGYKMTQFVSFATLATLIQRFQIIPVETYKVPLGILALPYDTLQFKFLAR